MSSSRKKQSIVAGKAAEEEEVKSIEATPPGSDTTKKGGAGKGRGAKTSHADTDKVEEVKSPVRASSRPTTAISSRASRGLESSSSPSAKKHSPSSKATPASPTPTASKKKVGRKRKGETDAAATVTPADVPTHQRRSSMRESTLLATKASDSLAHQQA